MINFRLLGICVLVNCFSSVAFGQASYAYKNVKSLQALYAQMELTIENAIKVEDYLPKNYDRHGTVDYTKYVQQALNRGGKILFPGFPIMINDNGVSVKSNSELYFEKGSRIVLKASSKGNYKVFEIYGVNNVYIKNLYLVGDRAIHKGRGGEWGMGIDIRNSKNIKVERSTITDCWGDGVYIGGEAPNEEIVIKDVFIDNCRRNGISVISAVNSTLSNLTISNTHGTAPMAGIDIEPNNPRNIIDNITIANYKSINNKSRGLLIDLRNFKGKQAKNVNISVSDFSDDGSYYGISMPLLGNHRNEVKGNIDLHRISFRNNEKNAIQEYDVPHNRLNISIKDHNINLNHLRNVLKKIKVEE